MLSSIKKIFTGTVATINLILVVVSAILSIIALPLAYNIFVFLFLIIPAALSIYSFKNKLWATLIILVIWLILFYLVFALIAGTH